MSHRPLPSLIVGTFAWALCSCLSVGQLRKVQGQPPTVDRGPGKSFLSIACGQENP